MVITGWCHEGNMIPGEVIQAEWSMVHFGQQMDSLLSPKYWCTSQFMAKFMAQIQAATNLAQYHKWPIPMVSSLCGSVSPISQ